MTTRQSHKRRGSTYETDLVKHLRSQGYDAERLHLAGMRDEGDIIIRHEGNLYLIEAKAPGAGNAIDLSAWTREATIEARNYETARGLPPGTVTPVVAIKARGKSIDKSYIISTLEGATPWSTK